MMTPLQRGVSAELSAIGKSQAQPLPPGSAQVQGQNKMLTQPRQGWYLCPPTIVPLSCEHAGSVELSGDAEVPPRACVNVGLHVQCHIQLRSRV